MTDTTDAGELNGQLVTASPKLIHLTAQRPKVKGRRLPKRQGSLSSSFSGGKDQSQPGSVVALMTDSPKLSHPTAERPRVRGRRPPKRYASPQPIENDRPSELLPTSLEDHLTEYQNTIQLIASDVAARNKCLTLRGSIKTMISSSITSLKNKAGKEGDTICDESEFEQLASQLESFLSHFEELLDREGGCLEEVEGQEGREELQKDVDEVRMQKRDLGELRAVQRTLHDPQEPTEAQQNVNEPLSTSDDRGTATSDQIMRDNTPEHDDVPQFVSKEIRRPPPLSDEEDTEEQRRSREVVSLSVHSRMVGFDTGRGTGEHGEEMTLEQDERTPLLSDTTKHDSASGGRLCDCCILL